jgi:threonylcarbamoyladenosine tRNA methylthiotransferase MtaB
LQVKFCRDFNNFTFFTEKDIEVTEFSKLADYYVINTCSVTANANKKSRNAIKRAIKLNPDAIIIVTGCYAQLRPEDITKIEGVDYIFGANNKEDIADIIKKTNASSFPVHYHTDHKEMNRFLHAFSAGDRTRSF